MSKELFIPMSSLQCAYMIERERGLKTTGTPCHVYMEFDTVQESQEIDFTYYDLQILSSKEKDEKLEEIRKDLFERNFNINKGPLICFVATRIDDKKTIVHICHDGLVADISLDLRG